MNILIVCGEYFNQSNGLSLSTQRFAEQFKRLGDEVRVLSSDHGGKSEYSVPVMRIPFVDGIMDQQNYHFAKPVRQVIQKALSWAELVHFEDPFPMSMEAAKLAAQMGLPITGTFHLYPENMTASVPIFDFPISNRNILNVFRWGVFQYCSAIQCPTEKVKERLAKSGYRSKLYVISNGIPSEIIAAHPCTKRNDRFTIISVGRYSNEKDQMTLMKAIRACRHAADIQLILAGKGPLEEKYQTFGQTLPNPPILRFYTQEELMQEIRSADLYVHCANVEIEGMGCMEAFAQGTVPLIADSELSSTASYALTERNRYQAGDAEELAEKIDDWFEHREELTAMGQRYIDLARTLTIEESAKKVRQMMLEAIREKQQSVPQEERS
ncbi:MAG: glycosyltransferase [Eubacteriales bacterium]|nr:glycosyltransferase [Eubacteriales bacterium]